MKFVSGLRLQVNVPYELDDNNSYTIIDYHRGFPNRDKSVWDGSFVSYDDEIDCFIETLNDDRITEKGNKRLGWGLRFQNGIQRIGIGTLPEKKTLYVAQFKNENGSKEWHGYPIDYEDTDYRVPDKVLSKWEGQSYINKRQKSYMKRCLQCL